MNETDIQSIQKTGDALVGIANTFTVENQEQADAANGILSDLTAGLKSIEAKRKTFTGPLNQSLKEINASFKAVVAPINEAKQGLSYRLMRWRYQEQDRINTEREKARKEEERRRKIQEAHAAKGHQVKEEITPVAMPVPLAQTDKTKTRLTWTYDVEDEDKVPREYLWVHLPSITSAVRSGVRVIPGVKIYQKETPIFG